MTKRAWRARNGQKRPRGGAIHPRGWIDSLHPPRPMVEVPRCFVSTLKAGVFLSAQTRLETALLAGRPHRGMECRQRLRTRGVEAPGTADWDAVCADARKTPPKRARGVSRNPLRTLGPLLPMAHESLISRKTGAEVPLTGLSFFSAKHRRQREPGISELPVLSLVRDFRPLIPAHGAGRLHGRLDGQSPAVGLQKRHRPRTFSKPVPPPVCQQSWRPGAEGGAGAGGELSGV